MTALRAPLRTILAAIFRSSASEIGERGAQRCRSVRDGRARVGTGGHLVHIGVRSVCAGMTALAIGFAAESVGRRVVGVPSAGQRTESALLSVFETIRPKSLDHRGSLVRVASLETGFLSNLRSRSRSNRRQRAATLLSASVFSSTSLRSTSALRAGTSLSPRRRTATATY